ncbi:hypothetical protein SCD92_13050 [Gilvimarinus sp. SDUM040013]|uniref:Uncharacterized protein n=2 Tax=Gilvimarinus gilvus TaxID=3058038 RepID=A0ABU4RZV1_9GAMM|nr:hypothetical protein [Gilvimarinus sp. SDUM040013]MDX6850295.1 hypothetical protein [Gilvimarinus sp. SDUM040013]
MIDDRDDAHMFCGVLLMITDFEVRDESCRSDTGLLDMLEKLRYLGDRSLLELIEKIKNERCRERQM